MSAGPATVAAVTAVLTGLTGVVRLCRERRRRAARRLRAAGEVARSPHPGTRVVAGGTAVDRVLGGASAVGRSLRRLAGRPPRPDADLRLGLAALVGLLATAVAGPAAGIVLATAAWAWPGFRRRSLAARRRAAVVDELPDVVDLLRLAVESGLTVSAALRVVADQEATGGPVVATLRQAVRQLALGDGLAPALDELAALGEPARPVHEAILAAHRHGVPLAPALARAAAEARDVRRRAGEEAARRLPVQLLFPLVFCTLPALLVLTVVPLLARSLPGLSP